MKYKVGTKKRTLSNKVVVNKLLKDLPYESSIKPVNATKAIETTKTLPKALGYLFFNDSPVQLKNPSSLLKVILAFFATMYGIPSRVSHEEIDAPMGFCCPKLRATLHPTIIPTKNIRFQKLSLVNRDLIKFMTLYLSKQNVLNFIITQFKTAIKIIAATVLILLLSVSHSFAEDLFSLITKTEEKYGIPKGLLSAIADVESGINLYAINVAGRGVIAGSKEKAIEIVRSYFKRGHTNIDLGVMQINWYWHGKHFNSIDEMFAPEYNVRYAAKLLISLYQQHGNWSQAVRYYHSATPKYYRKYSRKVLVAWLDG